MKEFLFPVNDLNNDLGFVGGWLLWKERIIINF